MQFKSVLVSSLVSATALAANSTSASSATVTGTSVCTYSDAYTASSQADLDKLNCATFQGDIVIEGDLTSASLASIQQVKGSLSIKNATQLQAFTADSLIAVSDTLSLTDLTVLSTLTIPSLAKVGTLQLQALPALEQLSFTSGLSDAQTIFISDTELSSLKGLNIISVDTLDVNNNKNLQQVNIPLQYASTSLAVTYNAEAVSVTFDDLIWANNITFRDVGSISLDNLTAVNQSLAFFNNTLESIVLDKLETIGGALSISDNDDLNEIEIPELTSIGGAFIVTGDGNLDSVSGLDSLKTVGGAITFSGKFTNASLPSLTSVKGGATINSTGNLDCSAFNALSKKGAIQGKGYSCKSPHTSTSAKAGSGSSSSGSSSDSGSGSSSSKKSDAIVLSTSFMSVVAAFALSLF